MRCSNINYQFLCKHEVSIQLFHTVEPLSNRETNYFCDINVVVVRCHPFFSPYVLQEKGFHCLFPPVSSFFKCVDLKRAYIFPVLIFDSQFCLCTILNLMGYELFSNYCILFLTHILHSGTAFWNFILYLMFYCKLLWQTVFFFNTH